jgi:predicted amidophosphoribosyltransferase
MAKQLHSFICKRCGAVCDRPPDNCEACGEPRQTPRQSFASLLMSIPFGDFERYRSPFRDLDL